MPKQLVIPPDEVFRSVIADAVQPVVAKLEAQIRPPLVLRVYPWCGARQEPPITISGTERGLPGRARGDVQISFRETYTPDRWLFRAQAVFSEEVAPGTGFSGFTVRGDVTATGAGINARPSSVVYNYNCPTFSEWA